LAGAPLVLGVSSHPVVGRGRRYLECTTPASITMYSNISAVPQGQCWDECLALRDYSEAVRYQWV